MAITITKNALRILAMNNASCKVFTGKKILNLRYLTECARKGKDYNFDELVADLPETSHMYAGIKAFAEYSLGISVIDENVITKFLGGIAHIEYVLEQLLVMDIRTRFGMDFADKFLFSHILIPIEITEAGSAYTGIYKNVDMNVEVKNLVVHPFITAGLSSGQRVFTHQALIIGAVTDKEIENNLLLEQASSAEFVKVAKNIKSIDYNIFWDLTRWTKETIKKL